MLSFKLKEFAVLGSVNRGLNGLCWFLELGLKEMVLGIMLRLG